MDCELCEEMDAVGHCHFCKRNVCGDCTGGRDTQGLRRCNDYEECDRLSGEDDSDE